MGLCRRFLRRFKRYYPSDRYLEKRYRGVKVPTEIPDYDDAWVVDTGSDPVEVGDINYVLSEFARTGVFYRFRTSDIQAPHHDHEHSFDGVLYAVVRDPSGFDYHAFSEDYSPQERKFLDAIIERYRQVTTDTVSESKETSL